MTDESLTKLTISELAPMIQTRQVSPVDLVDASIARIERLQPRLKSFINLIISLNFANILT